MHDELLTKLIRAAIDEHTAETQLLDAFVAMHPADRNQLIPTMTAIANGILEARGLTETDGLPCYLARRIQLIHAAANWAEVNQDWQAFDLDEFEPEFQRIINQSLPVLSMRDLVDELIDNTVEEYHLMQAYCSRLHAMDDDQRKEVCDLIIQRVRSDPAAQLPNEARDPVLDEFETLLRQQISET